MPLVVHWCLSLPLIRATNLFFFFVGWTNNFEKIKFLLKIICKKLVLY